MVQPAQHTSPPPGGRNLNFWKIIGIAIAAVIALLIIRGVVQATRDNGSTEDRNGQNTTSTTVTHNLTQGDTVFFDFGHPAGINPYIIYRATEDDVDFEIITPQNEGERSRGTDKDIRLVRPEDHGVFIVSHNKDTKMTVIIKN